MDGAGDESRTHASRPDYLGPELPSVAKLVFNVSRQEFSCACQN
jgi:hypothetical protein